MSSGSSSSRFAITAILIPLGVGVALLGVALIITLFWDGTSAYVARTEDGWIEKATIVSYALALVTCVVVAVVTGWKRGFDAAVLLGLLALREMDLDEISAAGETQKLSSIRYWRSDAFPLVQKLFIVLVLIAGAVALVRLCRACWGRVRPALAAGKPYAITVVTVVLFMLVSQILDNQIDWDALDNPIVLFLSLTEECLEAGIPILIAIAILQFGKEKGRRSGEN